MSEREIRRDVAQYTEDDDHMDRWVMLIDGEIVSQLWVSIETGEIMQVETAEAYQRQGLAAALYRQAASEIEIFHAPPAHRTPEGDAFARSVGGPVLDYCTQDYCQGCSQTPDFDDED